MQRGMPCWIPALTLPALILGAWNGPARADDGFQPDFHPVLNVSKVQGSIEIDGDLTDDGWKSAARATGFVEVNPGDNARPEVEAAALVTYDESNLFVALIAWDNPQDIRVSMSDRDAIFRDDYFGVMLDTYGDYAWGYEMFVNPLGIQGDLRLLSDGSEDISLDIVFESRGIVTDSGYQVELAIPFASLRFPDQPEQTWRLNFWRDRQRANRYRYAWAAQDRDNSCWFCQWGTLIGIRDIKPSSNLDLLPNIISYQSGSMSDPSIPDSEFGSQNPDAELSLNGRYGLSTSSSIELTVNPDFSQVESDAGQIDVNETFALFFSERRPFFQEGSDLYRSFFNVVHTRTINEPILAGKYTGQFGRYSVACLTARDDNTPLTIPLREQSIIASLENSTVNILRGRRTFGQDSYVGFVFTDRRTDDGMRVDTLYNLLPGDTTHERVIDTVRYGAGSGTVYGLDSRIRFNRNYRLEFMVLGSRTREPDGPDIIRDTSRFDYGNHTVALDDESYGGQAVYVGLHRGGRYWSFDLTYRELSATFRADNGFIGGGNDRRLVNLWTGLTFRPNREWLVQWGPRMSLARLFNHRATVNLDPATFDPGSRDEWWRPGVYFQLKSQTNLTLEYLASRERYCGHLLTGISRGFVDFNTRPSGSVEFGAFFEYGRKVVRFVSPPRMGVLTNFSAWGGFRLSQRLRIQPSLDHQKMNNRDHYLADQPDESRTIYEVNIFRTNINYQFTREWFLRLIVEYADFNSTQEPSYLVVEPLLTYRINPFTMFYLGAGWGGRHFENGYQFDRETHYSDASIGRSADTLHKPLWRLNQAQIFAKFQYLFRL